LNSAARAAGAPSNHAPVRPDDPAPRAAMFGAGSSSAAQHKEPEREREPGPSRKSKRERPAAEPIAKVKTKTKGVAAVPAAGAAAAAAPAAPDYNVPLELASGAEIKFPKLNAVVDNLVFGTEVQPKAWREMRESLSEAVMMPDKSHPPHGSNFNMPQRPEQQIIDWVKPIRAHVELHRVLAQYFFVRSAGKVDCR
jgi:hypothetical protein